jgi:hypothetical protein
MSDDRLAGDPRELPVVVVPPPSPVCETDEILVQATAARGEEVVDPDAVRPIGLAREQFPFDRSRKLARGRPVPGLHDAVDDKRPEERQGVPAAPYHRQIVGSNDVVASPEENRDGCRDAERGQRAEARTPRTAPDEEKWSQDDEDLAHGPNEHEERQRAP